MNVIDTCSTAVVSVGAPSPTTLSHTVTKAAVTATFTLASDNISVATSQLNACGPYSYRIVEGPPYITLNSATGTITVQTNDMGLIGGPYTVTLEASLTNYPGATIAT